ncbi:MAG: hypothetical protein AAB254_05400, partial [candidate division NC10 bacterium]
SSLVALPHSDRFNQQLAAALGPNPNQAQMDYLIRNHEYRIPVFNRGASAQFGLLVTRDDHARPTVSLDISHQGVRLEYREPGTDIFGVRRPHAQIAGLITGAVAVTLIVGLGASTLVAGAAGWLLGAFLLALGAFIVKVIRALGNLLS